MTIPVTRSARFLVLFLISSFFLTACSNSGDPASTDPETTIESAADNTEEGNLLADGTDAEPGTDASSDSDAAPNPDSVPNSDTGSESSTRIDFDITVPAYQSDSLQVRLIWGEKDLTARWVVDETWQASDNFPGNTEQLLSVTFSDDNGATILGNFETLLATGLSTTQTVRISAAQFDTARWDDDSDGISNINELQAGPDGVPTGAESESDQTLAPVTASLELMPVKTFRISWEENLAADFYRILENPDGVSGFTDVSGELDDSTEFYDHQVPLHRRVNARYMVEACNESACVTSAQLLTEGTLDAAIGYFKASNTDRLDNFGEAISLSGDGKTMAIGAPDESSAATGINGNQEDNSAARAGAVYVFVLRSNGWQQQAYIKASNTDVGDEFGGATALSSDGNTLVVAAQKEQSTATGINGDQADNSGQEAGAVYVFVRDGDNWQQQAYLKASNNRGEDFVGFGEFFGREISLSADGNTLAVAAFGEDSPGTGVDGNQNQDESTPSTRETGASYVFVRNNGTWQQQAYIKAATNESDRFGRAISLSGDGNTLAVAVYDFVTTDTDASTGIDAAFITSRGPDTRDSYGGVYIFARNNSTWQQQAFLRPVAASWIDFGDELSLSADGNVLAASVPRSVEMFERVNGDWVYQTNLTPSNNGGAFGSALTLSADGSTIAIGAPTELSGSTGLNGYQGEGLPNFGSGAAYVFTRPDGIWQQIAYVKASNSQAGISFGSALSLSANGNTLAIGAHKEGSAAIGINGDQHSDTGAAPVAGAVYLY